MQELELLRYTLRAIRRGTSRANGHGNLRLYIKRARGINREYTPEEAE